MPTFDRCVSFRRCFFFAAAATIVSSGHAADDDQLSVIRCGVRFLTPNSAEVVWESTVPGESAVAYGPTRKLGTIVKSPTTAAYHRVRIDGLELDQTYYYRIGVKVDGRLRFSPIYELDGRMNYSPPELPSDKPDPVVDQVVDSLVQPGGYAVVIGAELAESWASHFAARTTMTVIAGCQSDDELNRLRHRWYERGIYGVRLTAQKIEHLPASIANVVVFDEQHLSDAAKYASPAGILVSVGQPADSDQWQWQQYADEISIGRRKHAPRLAEWGHQYGSSANGSFVGETLDGVDDTSELEVRWLGRPGADFGIDRNPRMPAPLAIGGRLFHQGMNRMIALDAFNGAVLWSLEIPDLRRVNIPRDSANWCADRDHVFAITKDCLWRIDAATGEMIETVRMPETHQDGFDWGYVAVSDDSIIGTAVKAGSAYEDFWAKRSWYDGQGSSATAKVCGSAIFSIDKKYGTVRWSRNVDAVVHSTIAVTKDRMFVVEVDDEQLQDEASGKLKNTQIWANASIVCLDLATGKELWKQPVPKQDRNQVIAFGIADDQRYVFESSSKNQFHFVSLDAKTGRPQWSQSTKWPSDNHGAHMQHAVMMDGKLFVQPSILDAETGGILQTDTLGKRRGCATPVGAGKTIIYRGGSGPVSLWSIDKQERSEWTRLRPSCWLSTIPAQGMLFSPEAGGGCSCGGWMECSIGFAPKKSRDDPSPETDDVITEAEVR